MTDLAESTLLSYSNPGSPGPETGTAGTPRRSWIPMVVGAVVIAIISIAVAGVGMSRFHDAERFRDDLAKTNRAIDVAEKGRTTALDKAEAARTKAGTIDAQKADLEGRLKRLSATTKDVVDTSNDIIDDCLTPWTSHRIQTGQVLDCLPGAIRAYQSAVDAEAQAAADTRTSLTTIEGGLSD